jgi:hypothetical protein
MTCRTIKSEDGKFMAVVCSRTPTKRCKCGRPCTKLCDFPLTGAKAGKTCDEPMCDLHHVNQGPEIDYCLPHDRVAKAAESK